jgi:DNA-binding PucR family transcriptional regulator
MRPLRSTLPVAVIGAGPVGLAAAAHLLARGETPVVFEAGDAVGASIRQWRHVRFFSPWKYTVDAASVALLESTGWTLPDLEAAPTGAEIVARYLEPLAALGRLGDELEATLRAWFDRDMRIEETARALHVHPNTLRHRLRRFEEVTDANLRRPTDLTELWWALERRRLEGRAPEL